MGIFQSRAMTFLGYKPKQFPAILSHPYRLEGVNGIWNQERLQIKLKSNNHTLLSIPARVVTVFILK
jgi:hypothetical protein